eukprot:1384222-Alexandrium_andersonii.AAC.1
MASLPAGALGAPVVASPQPGCVGSSSTLGPLAAPGSPPWCTAELSPKPPGSGGGGGGRGGRRMGSSSCLLYTSPSPRD